MRKLSAIFFLAVLLPVVAFAQAVLWQDVKLDSVRTNAAGQNLPARYRALRLNKTAMAELLAKAPMEFTSAAKAGSVVITIPMPNGTLARFRVQESPMLSPQVAAQAPDWKTYSGQGIDDPTAVARFSFSASGFRGYILGASGAILIDPAASGDTENYIVYNKADLGDEKGSFHCEIDRLVSQAGRAKAIASTTMNASAAAQFANGANLKTYRLAIATTGEYTVDRGGQDSAFADVMNAVNRINTVYRRDASVTFTLVSGKNTVFADPATDPYNNSDDSAQLAINQTQLDTIIGAGNYDIGHLFGTGGGGIASTPSVCSTQKAEGYSARVPPTGDAFWVDYVAHEMGHQFSAQHTYNTKENGPCQTRSDQDAYEVASGATIMSYVGICTERNLQQNAVDNFHVRSLDQIIGELSNTNGGGGTCGSSSATGNNVPTVNAGASFTIPKGTPFTLTATGADQDGDALTYSWEEFDLAAAASGPLGTPANTYDVDSDGVLRPLFRVYAPTTNPSRTFPALPYILNNANTPPLTYTGTSPTGAICEQGVTCVTGEILPSVTRTMNFRVAARDNKGGTVDAATQVNVRGESGPFVVTSPNTATTALGANQFTVTWNVANTTATPINCANVKISLSTDGGNTFPTVLLASTANDGSEAVTLPDVSVTTARIKVEAVDNIFFDVSDTNFTISATGNPTPTPSPSPSATPGNAPTGLANISTRLRVATGDDALIGGLIITGNAPKKVIIRGIGPSLGDAVPDKLANPTLQLFDPDQKEIAFNDDWKNASNQAEIAGSGVAPTNDLESAILISLNPGTYTAVVRGVNDTQGIGLVEAYDLDRNADSKFANISTRGVVLTGDNAMIGGFFVLGQNTQKVIVRALGPSLQIAGKKLLDNPTLELRNGNGDVVRADDDWRTGGQESEIQATTIPPTSELESALVETLTPGGYTAIVRGVNDDTGIGVVEVYALQP